MSEEITRISQLKRLLSDLPWLWAVTKGWKRGMTIRVRNATLADLTRQVETFTGQEAPHEQPDEFSRERIWVVLKGSARGASLSHEEIRIVAWDNSREYRHHLGRHMSVHDCVLEMLFKGEMGTFIVVAKPDNDDMEDPSIFVVLRLGEFAISGKTCRTRTQ